MIKMTYKSVSNGMFVHTMQRLVGMKMNAQKAYWLKKLVDSIESQQKKIDKEYRETVEPKLHKNEIVKEEGKPDQAKPLTEEQMKANEELLKVFGEQTFEIDRAKLDAGFFIGLDVSAAELTAIEDLVDLDEPTPAATVLNNIKSLQKA